MQLLKNQVNPFNGNKSKSIRSKASIFVNCLVKLCFVPITATHEKIVFTILHWKTVVNLLFLGFNLSFVFCLQLLNIKNQFNQYENDLEKTSVYILGFLAIFVRLLPLIMSNGLQNLNFRRINNGSHQSPNKRFLLSILLFIIGLFFTIVDMEDLASLPSLNIVGFLSLFTIMSVIESLYVFSLPILIQILTKDFNFSCLKASAKDNYKDVIDWYQELNKSLQLYCLCFYSYNQFTFIFNIYKNFSSFKMVLEISNICRLLGKILMIVSMVLNVTDLTIALDSAYESLQVVKMKIQENLMITFEKSERQELKFLLETVKALRPMNACGYFEISKSTLTSMLSVRYKNSIYDDRY